VGLLVTLPDAAKLTSVGVESPSDGTIVEIRTSSSADPSLSDTTVLATATLTKGHTDIALPAAQPSRYILVWLTRLGGSAGSYSSTINELTFQRA